MWLSTRPVFRNRRDLETFLPGLEQFCKLKNSLNSALKRYQVLKLVKKGLEMLFKQNPSRHLVVNNLIGYSYN
jgi:hypothetical protein